MPRHNVAQCPSWGILRSIHLCFPTRSLAYQLGLRYPEIAGNLLALEAGAVSALQQPGEALSLLVLGPLKALPKGRRAVVRSNLQASPLRVYSSTLAPSPCVAAPRQATAVSPRLPSSQVLIDALDEGEPPGSKSALANSILRLVTSLCEAGALVIATTRPNPPHIVDALRGRWGSAAFIQRTTADFVVSVPSVGGPLQLTEDWAAAFARHSGSKVFCTLASAILSRFPAAAGQPPPASLCAAYKMAFELESEQLGAAANAPAVARLLQLLVSAREPPSVAALAALGARNALPFLPFWGVLFQASALLAIILACM